MGEENNKGFDIKKLLLFGGPIGCSTAFFIFFPLFVVLLFVLGLFEGGNGSSGGVAGNGSGECGFTISKTSLSKSEYKEKLEEYAVAHSNFKIFAENANDIYEVAVSMNVNPELVPIRAQVEGQGTTTGSYNYWGINCTNEGQGTDCRNYSSFEEGYTDFLNIVSAYDSLASMMQKYAYIGDYWYTLDTAYPESDGGCYYAPYIYEDGMPSHVSNACSSSAPSCVMGGSTANCTATTADDQTAYAKWQVKNNMGSIRKTIFGLEFDDGPCTGTSSTSFDTLSSYNLNHNNLTVLDKKLSSSQVADLNDYIDSEVDKAGYGTGAGVAAAGQALTYWLEKQGYYLQYRWGGGHGSNFVGVNPNWGSNDFGCDSKGRCYNGMDCSGFVSWAIRTACSVDYGSKTTYDMKHGPSISVEKAQPGDLMLNSVSHVRLVLKNNGDGTVIVAEESGGNGGLIFSQQSTSSGYSFIDMSDYYSKICKSSR